jgi:hypothetical protein
MKDTRVISNQMKKRKSIKLLPTDLIGIFFQKCATRAYDTCLKGVFVLDSVATATHI